MFFWRGRKFKAKIADFGLSRIVPKKKESERKHTALNLFDQTRVETEETLQCSGQSTSSFSSLHFTNAAMTSAKGTVAYVVLSLEFENITLLTCSNHMLSLVLTR